MSSRIEYQEIHIQSWSEVPKIGAWKAIWPDGKIGFVVDGRCICLGNIALGGSIMPARGDG